jgi:OmcA/MtrC family decaheme c-type cytochrome
VVVLDDGLQGEEYLRVSLVEGQRLWFGPPAQTNSANALRHPHAAGGSVLEVQLATRTFAIDALNGTVTEAAEFGAEHAVLVSYVVDYLVPSTYPQAPNGSNDLNDQHGKWTGLPLVGGTYVASVTAVRDFDYRFGTTATPYRSISPSATRDVLVGDALDLVSYTRVLDGESCNACHQELTYHGRYKGFDTCIQCHGSSGAEDLPRSVASGAPATPGRSVEFRTLLHKIHRGQELEDESYRVVGAGTAPYPDNFVARVYHDYTTLPSYPDRTLDCARCHGESNTAALLPAEREHPSAQSRPLQTWRPACASCHDGDAVIAHVDSNTAPNGAEACAICHDPGELADGLFAHQRLLEPR